MDSINLLLVRGGFDCIKFGPAPLTKHRFDNFQWIQEQPFVRFDYSFMNYEYSRYERILDEIGCFSQGMTLIEAVAHHVQGEYATVHDGPISRKGNTAYSSRMNPLSYVVNNITDISFQRSLVQFEPDNHMLSFTQPIDTYTSRAIVVISALQFPVVTTKPYNMLGILRPYHMWTWVVALCMAFLCIMLLTLFVWSYQKLITPLAKEDKLPGAKQDTATVVRRAVEMVMRIFFEQDTPGWPLVGNKMATTLLLGWGFFCAIFCNVYKSEILSAMTADLRANNTPFRDFVSMQAAGFKIAGERGFSEGIIRNLLHETAGTAEGNAFRSILLPKTSWPADMEDSLILRDASDKKIASFEQSDVAGERERVVEISYATNRSRMTLPTMRGAYLVRKETGNQTKINKAVHRQLARLQETGVWLAADRRRQLSINIRRKKSNKQYQQLKSTKPLMHYERLPEKMALNFKHMISPFMLLSLGFLSAMIAYLMENKFLFLTGLLENRRKIHPVQRAVGNKALWKWKIVWKHTRRFIECSNKPGWIGKMPTGDGGESSFVNELRWWGYR